MTTRKRPGSQRSTFRELLLDHTKKLGLSDNALAKLLRDMLLTHGISPSQWDKMADLYYRKINTNSKGEVDLLKVTHDKSNMAKALAKDSIPFRRFQSAIEILGCESFVFSVQLNFRNDVTYKHEVFQRNRMAEPGPVEDDEDESDE